MPGKYVGDPCPKCAAMLIRRRRASLFRSREGDVAYCAPCNAAWDIEGEESPATSAQAVFVIRAGR